MHPEQQEADAVTRLFEMYATGSYTFAKLAHWMNEQGLRTRNTKMLTDAHGNEATGPRKFTIYSVRWILHNPFFAGHVAHGKELHQGKHKSIISQGLFDTVQKQLKKSRAQRHTSGPTYRTYLLKGLLKCVWCGLPVWCETLHGQGYYRERKGTRSEGGCPNEGKTVRTEVLDEQVGRIVESIKLDASWERRMAGIIHTLDKRAEVESERHTLEQKLRRLGKTYRDGLIDDDEYELQQRVLKTQLDSLVVPEERSTLQAGHLLENLPLLWQKASPEERHSILNGFLECVYVDIQKPGTVVGIKPKPQFMGLFQFMEAKSETPVSPEIKSPEPQDDSELDLTGWWRRGRVELPVQKSP